MNVSAKNAADIMIEGQRYRIEQAKQRRHEIRKQRADARQEVLF